MLLLPSLSFQDSSLQIFPLCTPDPWLCNNKLSYMFFLVTKRYLFLLVLTDSGILPRTLTYRNCRKESSSYFSEAASRPLFLCPARNTTLSHMPAESITYHSSSLLSRHWSCPQSNPSLLASSTQSSLPTFMSLSWGASLFTWLIHPNLWPSYS